MPRKRTYATARGWFSQWPAPDPPGWDDKNGWCRRHWAPVTCIADPVQREVTARLASLDMMVSAAGKIRATRMPDVNPMRLTQVLKERAPVCCWLGDNEMWTILLAAEIQSRHGRGEEGWTVPQ
jgi:hypothetical protein